MGFGIGPASGFRVLGFGSLGLPYRSPDGTHLLQLRFKLARTFWWQLYGLVFSSTRCEGLCWNMHIEPKLRMPMGRQNS